MGLASKNYCRLGARYCDARRSVARRRFSLAVFLSPNPEM